MFFSILVLLAQIFRIFRTPKEKRPCVTPIQMDAFLFCFVELYLTNFIYECLLKSTSFITFSKFLVCLGREDNLFSTNGLWHKDVRIITLFFKPDIGGMQPARTKEVVC